MDWSAIRATCPEGRLLVAVPSPRLVEAISDAGLIALEVEAGASAIPERITLALIEAVANDHLTSGARVIVVYSGFEAETLDSLTVVRLGEHLERLTSRDLRALETSVPFETLKAVVDVRCARSRKAAKERMLNPDYRRRCPATSWLRTYTLGFDPFRGYCRKEGQPP